MKITVAFPYTIVGQEYPETIVWGPASMPELPFGTPIEWDDHDIWAIGKAWRKQEYDQSGAPVR